MNGRMIPPLNEIIFLRQKPLRMKRLLSEENGSYLQAEIRESGLLNVHDHAPPKTLRGNDHDHWIQIYRSELQAQALKPAQKSA